MLTNDRRKDTFVETPSEYSFPDYITGGYTRTGFLHAVEQMRSNGSDLTRFAMLYINIRAFKAVNESLGECVGNLFLKYVYDRLMLSELHPVVGSRIDADHFVLFVEKSDLDMEELSVLLDCEWEHGGRIQHIHCRCGIFYVDNGNLPIHKMIDRAKLAEKSITNEYAKLYAVFKPVFLSEYHEQTEALAHFERAIGDREFSVYYQPIVCAKTGEIVAAEALSRRITADGTVIPPQQFVPVLEHTGYITRLDRFVTEEVTRFQRERMVKGLPLIPISVNISQNDFYDPEAMELLASNLKAGALPHGCVVLELTESTYALQEQRHEDYLNMLCENGVEILLDDFGSGYSSFAMFKNYFFAMIKLDKGFVDRLCDNYRVWTVVESIIAMCHKLNIRVVAEGVETEEQLASLREMGCDYIQGFYFSLPLDEAGFTEYLRLHH